MASVADVFKEWCRAAIQREWRGSVCEEETGNGEGAGILGLF